MPIVKTAQLGHGVLPGGVDAPARGAGERVVRRHPGCVGERLERELEEVPLLPHVPQRLVLALPGLQAGDPERGFVSAHEIGWVVNGGEGEGNRVGRW